MVGNERRVVRAVLPLWLGACAHVRGGHVNPIRARVDARLPALLDSAGVPGFAVAVVVRGRIVLERTYGR